MMKERIIPKWAAVLVLCAGVGCLLFIAGVVLRGAVVWGHNYPAWFETGGQYSMLTNYGPIEAEGSFFGGDHLGSSKSFWCLATPETPSAVRNHLRVMMARNGLRLRNDSSHRKPDLIELEKLAAEASWSFPGRAQGLANAQYFTADSKDGKDYWIVFIYPAYTTTRAEIACLSY